MKIPDVGNEIPDTGVEIPDAVKKMTDTEEITTKTGDIMTNRVEKIPDKGKVEELRGDLFNAPLLIAHR